MGLPEINIEFKRKATNAIKRSAMGIVALILKDDTQTLDTVIYNNVSELEASEWSPENADYIQKTFLGNPSKVIIERLDSTVIDYSAVQARLNNKRFNYLAIPNISDEDATTIAAWIKTKRDDEKKTFKAVLPNQAADHEGIINVTTEDIVVDERTYSASEYTARIAGILAGLSFTQSATYYVLDEVKSVAEVEDADAAIDAGELILINDGEKIKIGRGVNSLVTIPEKDVISEYIYKTEDFKKIKVLEVMDMVKDDIRDTFNDLYVGKVPNVYDNQVLFLTTVNTYFKDIADDDILDPNFNNHSTVNVEAQRKAWEKEGVDTTDWDEQKIKEMSFKSNVFVAGAIKIVDATEDLDFSIAI